MPAMSDPAVPEPSTPRLSLTGSRAFPLFLHEAKLGLALSTYQSGKLFLLGLKDDGTMSFIERPMSRCMGLWSDGDRLFVSSQYSVWRFDHALSPGERHEGFDRYYAPRVGYVTGDVDVHDLEVEASGRVLLVNTAYGCIAELSAEKSFVPLWKPPFLSRLAPEDRCHLNGLALEEGRAAYVTTVSGSDIVDGWRDRKRDGGLVLDVRTNEVVARGLSMPHSPRVANGELWVLEAGTGYLCRIDRGKAGAEGGAKVERVTFLPGYARGMCTVGHLAIIATSRPRPGRSFDDLELGPNLRKKDAEPRCSLQIVDLRTGDIVNWLRVEGPIDELYDVAALARTRRPTAIGFAGEAIARHHVVGEMGSL